MGATESAQDNHDACSSRRGRTESLNRTWTLASATNTFLTLAVSSAGAVSLQMRAARHTANRPLIDCHDTIFGLRENAVDHTRMRSQRPAASGRCAATTPGGCRAPRLHVMLPRIRDIDNKGWPGMFERIQSDARMREAPDPAPVNSTATFFSGGADSFWSLVKQQQVRAVASRPLTTDRTLPFRDGTEVHAARRSS